MNLSLYIKNLGEHVEEIRIDAIFESDPKIEAEVENLPKDIQLDFLYAMAQLNVAELLLKKVAIKIEENTNKQ